MQHCPRIMIVDDEPKNLKLLEEMISQEGFQVFALPTGELALKALSVNTPDLMLLDIKMPGLNGYQVCQYMT